MIGYDNSLAYYCICNFIVYQIYFLTVFILERNLLELVAFAKQKVVNICAYERVQNDGDF